tara:strand:+ start:13 stop:582 length:570 start_codon:yes stop_codon:yes gene_type:complete
MGNNIIGFQTSATSAGGGAWTDLASASATDTVTVSTDTFTAKKWLNISVAATGFDTGTRSDPNFQLNFQSDTAGDSNTRYSTTEFSTNDDFAERTAQARFLIGVNYQTLPSDGEFYSSIQVMNSDVNTQLAFFQSNVFDGTATSAAPYGMIGWGAYVNEQITKVTFSTSGDGTSFGHFDLLQVRVLGHD